MAKSIYTSPFRKMLGPNAVERGQEELRREEPPSNAHIYMGIVVDVNQQKQLHMVRCAGKQFFCPCLDPTGNTFYGARNSALFPVGSYVLVATTGENNSSQGTILGGIPPASAHAEEFSEISFALSCELAPGTPIGPYKDKISAETFKRVLDLDPSFNKNAGRPIDAYPGDIVQITELGCGFWAGRALASLRAGHDVAVECHYTDSLLRLCGFNMEVFTAGADTTMFNDEGAYTEIRRLSPYPVESMGGFDLEEPVPSKEGEKREDSKFKTASRIPEEEEQVGFFRYLHLTGYLGDLDSIFVTVPQDEAEAPRVAGDEFKEDQDYVGLLRQTISEDGAYTLQAAKSIMLSKDIMIPVPQEIFRPDDPRGSDQDEGYKPNTLTKEPTEFEEDKPFSRGMTSQDLLARQTNYLQNTALQEHTEAEGGKDWSLTEVAELKFGSETGTSWDEVGAIPKGEFWSALPKTANIKIDPRNTEGKYFVSKSIFCMHEDGSIHIEDGYGSHFSMRGGSIDISCPGTMTLRPGNDLVSVVGKTASIICGENVELTAMKGDARIHGNRNVSILGGNDGKGGVLIESKSEGTHFAPTDSLGISDPREGNNAYNGIFLKAKNSTVSMIGKQSYIGCDESDGIITLDANDSGQIVLAGDSLRSVTNTMYLVTGDPDNLASGCHLGFRNDGNASLQFNQGLYLYSDQLLVTGSGAGSESSTVLDGMLRVRQSILAVESILADTITLSEGIGSVSEGSVTSSSVAIFDNAVDRAKASQDSTVRQASEALQEFLLTLEEALVRDVDGLKKVTFCYPDTQERGVPTFDDEPLVIEATWQTRYRSAGSGEDLEFVGVNPDEEVGSSPAVSTSISSVWPGATVFENSFAEMEYKFIDADTGSAVDRAGGKAYNEPIPAPKISSLDKYKVNTANQEPGQ